MTRNLLRVVRVIVAALRAGPELSGVGRIVERMAWKTSGFRCSQGTSAWHRCRQRKQGSGAWFLLADGQRFESAHRLHPRLAASVLLPAKTQEARKENDAGTRRDLQDPHRMPTTSTPTPRAGKATPEP
jgi:hypothetical protein